MHQWGDEWFEQNGDDLYKAIDFIEDYLHKHHIGVYGKEKYGTYRDEYLRFWEGGLYQILFGNRIYIGTKHCYKWKWMETFANKVHQFIYYKIDEAIPQIPLDIPIEEYEKYYKKRIWHGLKDFNWRIGLTQLVQKHQAKYYNYAFQLACQRWPHVQEELIVCVDGYKMIKPCKYGNIDGTIIHNKYWKVYD